MSLLKMQIESATISVKGKRVSVPSVNIDGSTIIVTGQVAQGRNGAGRGMVAGRAG